MPFKVLSVFVGERMPMKNKKKRTIKAKTLAFSLLLFVALTYAVPAQAYVSDVSVKTDYAQVDGKTKNEFKKDYQTKKKKAKADYRKTVNILKIDLAKSLQSSKLKGERIEARRRYKEGLKVADQRLNNTLKESKEEYKRQISA